LSRRLTETHLVLATHNAGKLRELQALLGPRNIEVVSAAGLRLGEPVEDGGTFEDNARIKAQTAAAAAGLPALADDSGIAAWGLDGAPGIHSARWAGPDKDFRAAMARVREELVRRYGSFALADRRAAFIAALCLAWPDGHEEMAVGLIDGELVDPPRGTGGFGYDPMFMPEGFGLTFAEMTLEAKQALSHRGRALQQLLERCFPLSG
jgi:XTP/dITP diphosphohydrolase